MPRAFIALRCCHRPVAAGSRALAAAWAKALALTFAASLGLSSTAYANGLEWQQVQPRVSGAPLSFDAVIEANRQSVAAAQVPGAIIELRVKVGDRVAAGQVMVRLDARAADQVAAASDAQVAAARAALDVASRDLARQQQLFEQGFISRAALDRAESVFRSTQAQLQAQGAQAGASRTQSVLHVVRAPFAGIVSAVPVALGDMAMPGRALVTVYDPTALRVTASVPESVSARTPPDTLPRVELPETGASSRWIQPTRAQWLPTLDATTNTIELRADLPRDLQGLAPGQHVRLWLPGISSSLSGVGGASVSVPVASVVRRAELTGVYVRDSAGDPILRQVRLGRVTGDQVEVLAGLVAGDFIAKDPQAAGRLRHVAR